MTRWLINIMLMDIELICISQSTSRLAVEYDEFDHGDKETEFEVKRQKLIEQKLRFKFVDYNPDEKDFCILNVTNQIYLFIQCEVNRAIIE